MWPFREVNYCRATNQCWIHTNIISTESYFTEFADQNYSIHLNASPNGLIQIARCKLALTRLWKKCMAFELVSCIPCRLSVDESWFRTYVKLLGKQLREIKTNLLNIFVAKEIGHFTSV